MIHDNDAVYAKNLVPQPDDFAANSSGMVLVVVVVLTALAAILAAGLYFASSARIKQVQHEVTFEKAFFVAEAGLERAKAELNAGNTNLTAVLTGYDGVTNTADDGLLAFGAFTNYGNGKFYIHVR